MHLREFLLTRTVSERETVQQKLSMLGTHSGLFRQFCLNVEIESRLPESAWNDVVAALLGSVSDVDEIARVLSRVFESHTLCGGAMLPPQPPAYGRAVNKEDFISLLIKLRYFNRRSTAARFVSQLASMSLSDVQKKMQRKLLGRYVMWATFDQTTLSIDPWAGMPSDADGIRSRLGLDTGALGMDLLLLTYSLPTGTQPLFPTVADACAGGGWLWYFRPAGTMDKHGSTMPWTQEESPCAEVVHSPITGDNIIQKILLVRPRVGGLTP